jgi:hypothetical protein
MTTPAVTGPAGGSRRPGSLRALRIVLIVVLLIVGVNAVGGGIYGLSGARDVDPAWLEGSPFDDYFWPSLILLLGVGGSHLLAAVLNLTRARTAPWFALAAGVVLVIWILTQVAIITLNSWLQPTFFVVGVFEMVAATRMIRRAPRNE